MLVNLTISWRVYSYNIIDALAGSIIIRYLTAIHA